VQVALVNTNRMRPPIAPIGLEYVAETLAAAGHEVRILDLCWADDVNRAVAGFFGDADFGLVGVSLRNTDDCAFINCQSFLKDFAAVVAAIRARTDAMIVAGGVGFSTMPEAVLDICRADAGIRGGGEFAMAALADRLDEGRALEDVPGLVWREDGAWRRNPLDRTPLSELPPMTRSLVDNRRYFGEGGQGGFETKRGCPHRCVYCADPVAKGRRVLVRPPEAVADELECLLEQEIDHLHTCDCEFNALPDHASAVCEELIRRGLGERLRWYAYCTPATFSADLAQRMRRAGCAGINFGADNGDAGMLKRLRRGFAPEDIERCVAACKKAGVTVMLDLLLGSPGETEDSLRRTIALMKRIEPDRVGVSCGMRVYPGTEVAQMAARGELERGLSGGPEPAAPLVFMEPAVADIIFPFLDRLIADDPRFLFFDPTRPDVNYNYNANERLVEAIRKGYRGAYWDILRRYEG